MVSGSDGHPDSGQSGGEGRLGHVLSQPVPGCLDRDGKLPV